MTPQEYHETEYEVLGRVALALALEAQEAATTSRDFGKGLSHGARMVARMRDEAALKVMGE